MPTTVSPTRSGRRPRVVVLGGGFAGLEAARGLAREPVDVTLVDRTNHHLFQPLLYQVATAGLSPADIAAPIRRVLRRQRNVTVLMAEARSVDLDAREVAIDGGETLPYDHLVVATGAAISYFGHDDWRAHAPGLKDVSDALEVRRRVLRAFEAAEREHDAASRAVWLTQVVVGGGPTGVELAGALAEIARRTLARDFRRFDPASTRVVLVEGDDRLLTGFPRELSERARRMLESMGVEVRTGTRVTAIDEHGVDAGGERIPTRTVIWAAGVEAASLTRAVAAERDAAGRLRVGDDLSLPGHREVHVAGDAAAVVDTDGRPVPGMAPAAIQMGRHVAGEIGRALAGEPPRAFAYRDAGMLATVGRSAAVAHVFGVDVSGLLAWLLWIFVHVAYLIGFRNRVVVLFEWAWAWASMQRSARLIVDGDGDPGGRASRGAAPDA